MPARRSPHGGGGASPRSTRRSKTGAATSATPRRSARPDRWGITRPAPACSSRLTSCSTVIWCSAAAITEESRSWATSPSGACSKSGTGRWRRRYAGAICRRSSPGCRSAAPARSTKCGKSRSRRTAGRRSESSRRSPKRRFDGLLGVRPGAGASPRRAPGVPPGGSRGGEQVALHRLAPLRNSDRPEIGEGIGQAGGRPQTRSLERGCDHQGVGRALAPIMIVGDDEHLLRPLRQTLRALDPGSELLEGVKVIIPGEPLSSRLEPVRGVTPMKPDIGDRRGDMPGRPKGGAERGLVDVAEADPQVMQEPERLLMIPTPVPELRNQRQPFEQRGEAAEVAAVLRQVVEGMRELRQNRSQEPGGANRLQPAPESESLRIEIDPARRRRRDPGPGRMGQRLIQLGSETEAWPAGRPGGPGAGGRAVGLAIERDIDFDDVKEACQEGQTVEAARRRRGVDNSLPVRIVPTGDPCPDHALTLRGGGVL